MQSEDEGRRDYKEPWEEDRRKKVQCWCFTWNNYDDEDINYLCTLGESEEVKFLVAGHEVGKDKGTPHMQGFIVFVKAKTFVTVRGLLEGCHISPMRTNQVACYRYCIKEDDDPILYGTPPLSTNPGRNKQIIDHARNVKWAEKRKFEKIAETDPGSWTRHQQSYRSMGANKRRKLDPLQAVCGIWCYGNRQTGKSTWAREFGSRYGRVYEKYKDTNWNCYEGQETVFIDEVTDKHDWLFEHLLQWADKDPFPVNEKYGQNFIRPKWIIIGSNQTMEQCFGTRYNFDALKSKFMCKKFTKVYDRPHALEFELSEDELNQFDPRDK